MHWDGAKAGGEPAVIKLAGMGPVTTTQVDENGKLIPRQAQTGNAAQTDSAGFVFAHGTNGSHAYVSLRMIE